MFLEHVLSVNTRNTKITKKIIKSLLFFNDFNKGYIKYEILLNLEQVIEVKNALQGLKVNKF